MAEAAYVAALDSNQCHSTMSLFLVMCCVEVSSVMSNQQILATQSYCQDEDLLYTLLATACTCGMCSRPASNMLDGNLVMRHQQMLAI